MGSKSGSPACHDAGKIGMLCGGFTGESYGRPSSVPAALLASFDRSLLSVVVA